MRQQTFGTTGLKDVQKFLNTLQEFASVATDMGSQQPIILFDYFSQTNQFPATGISTRRIRQSEGETMRSLVELSPQQPAHLIDLTCRSLTTGKPHHRQANRAMTDQGNKVQSYPCSIQSVAIGREVHKHLFPFDFA